MLGHVFLGNGDTAGNVSQSNVREANRLLKQAMNSGGMPKGRGLYERMGRGVNMFQAWWGGAGDDLKQACASLPDVEPLDLGRFTPLLRRRSASWSRSRRRWWRPTCPTARSGRSIKP